MDGQVMVSRGGIAGSAPPGRRTARRAVIAALVASALAGCAAPPETAAPAAPAAATTAAAPTTTEVLLPDEGERSEAPGELTDWTTDRTLDRAWLLDACQPTDYPTDQQRLSFRTVSQTGPESLDARQLAEYPSPEVAGEAMDGFRRALAACATGRDPQGISWEWRTQDVSGLGEDAFLAATTSVGDDGVPHGGSRIAVTRVDDQVFMAYTFGEIYTAELDHSAAEVQEVAQRFVDLL